MKITDEQVKVAEEISSEVYDKQLTASEGAKILAEIHGININSARDFINDYRHMMQGRVFHRAMSSPAINYFLLKIREKRGDQAHTLAVSAVDQHINYYEQLSGTNLKSMRSILDLHKSNSSPIELEIYNDNFIKAVKESIQDSSNSRAVRLKKAARLPTKITVISHVFMRNADVVAEVIMRAKGKCERCKQDAPFKRKKDLQPYLEVHHIVQLAKGGEDTVENAIALCPNCHRHLHFGILVN